MKKNGFITPTTLIICFILFSFVLHQLIILQQERDSSIEIREAFILEQLLQMATTDLLNELSNASEFDSGKLHYQAGSVTYHVISHNGEEIGVRLKGNTNEGRTNQIVLYYNLVSQQLISWMEV